MPYANEKIYTKFRFRLVLGSCLLVVFLIISLVWKISSSYKDEKTLVKLQTKNFTQAMSAHVLASIQFMDLSLISTADTIRALSTDSQISPEAIKQSRLTGNRMSDANFWLMFINAQGRGVVASNNLPVAGLSYADRRYFSAHIQNENLGLYVGGPIVGKSSKRRIFALSRRVTSSTGQFLGVIAALVDPNAFAQVFTNALFNPNLNITLSHREGLIVARVPRFEESFAASLVESPLFKHLAVAPNGSYEAKSVIDGENRIYAYESIENLPLVVSVGMSNKSLTTGLVDDLFTATAGLTVIIVILLISGNYALHSFRKVVESEEKHRQSNEALEAAQKSLTRLATVDILTGLPNRNSLYDRLVQALARSNRTGAKVGCLYMDIDHFKQVNDTLGHAGGDELLKQFSARIQVCLRQTDTFARLAGDEFIAIIEDLDQPDTARLAASKIIEAMQRPFFIEGVRSSVTASIGVVIANSQTDDPNSLLRKADAALYCAKREGRNLYRLYETQGDLIL